MINKLHILNFKSIKNLRLDCRRVNIFIGDPNVGKSNILEAVSLLSFHNKDLTDFVRFDNVSQIFFDYDAANAIEVNADNYGVTAYLKDNVLSVDARYDLVPQFSKPFLKKFTFNGSSSNASYNEGVNLIPKVLFYKYDPEIVYQKTDTVNLDPPFGSNLASVIFLFKDLRIQVQNLVEGLGYKLLYKPNDSNIEIYKEFDGYSISFPLSLVSDTVRKMIFYVAAFESNKDSTILIEEPESNTFPLYIKSLAERIARFNENQFFITTHNPYFLQSIIEKTSVNDLAIHLVDSRNHQTCVQTLDATGVEKILELTSDVFLNFDALKKV